MITVATKSEDAARPLGASGDSIWLRIMLPTAK